jgi:hypothetical protein
MLRIEILSRLYNQADFFKVIVKESLIRQLHASVLQSVIVSYKQRKIEGYK